MNARFIRLATGGWLALAMSALQAQDITTNSIYTNPRSKNFPVVVTLKYHQAVLQGRSFGEHALLPPGLKEKMQLTPEQKKIIKPIEEDFADASQRYEATNQCRIDAAGEVSRQVRGSKNAAQVRAARAQSQAVWAGLQPDRDSAVNQIRPILTPEQIAILEDPKNHWRENHVFEANDPSAN